MKGVAGAQISFRDCGTLPEREVARDLPVAPRLGVRVGPQRIGHYYGVDLTADGCERAGCGTSADVGEKFCHRDEGIVDEAA